MNDETEIEADEPEGPVGGERLRAARRANDISVGDIAKELHLDEPKVRALERNEFDVLGAPVFAKGHLRKYAELVGVPVDDIMSDYYRMNRASAAPPVVGPKRSPQRNFSVGPWLIGVVILLLAAAAAYWWFSSEVPVQQGDATPAALAPFSVSEDPAPEENARQEVNSEPLAAPESADNVADEVVASPEPAPVSATIVPAQPRVEDAPRSQAPQVTIDLAFSAECWTEVSDAAGNRLYYDLGRAGRVVTLTGDAPLRVILGDSGNVSITVDGRDYPIPASARNGRLARLNINRQ